MIHLGFSGTRHGLSDLQLDAIRDLLDDILFLDGFTAHHGLCVGGDEEFHGLCREPRGGPVTIVGHPGPDGPLRSRVQCDQVMPPKPYMARNADIVVASHIMIAAPYEDRPRVRGGTHQTIRMALQRKALRELYVVGRDGQLLDHGAWR